MGLERHEGPKSQILEPHMVSFRTEENRLGWKQDECQPGHRRGLQDSEESGLKSRVRIRALETVSVAAESCD